MRFVSYMTPGFPPSLFEVLAREIGAELHLEEATSGPASGADPFADGRFDLGWVCSTSFVELAMNQHEPSVRLAGVAWVPDDPDADDRPVYFGDVVVRSGSGIRTLDDLAGSRIGCNDPVSLSGHQALRFEIERRGGSPDTFAELVLTGGHHRSLDLLVAGKLDAAVVDSVVRVRRARHDPFVAALRIVDRLGPWPVQPLVASTSLPDHEVDEIARKLLAAADRRGVRDELDAAALRRLVSVGPDHYQPVHDAMRRSAES